MRQPTALGDESWRPGVRQRGGFTLVELLTVIAIISLLLSILAPSLRRARKMLLNTTCQSNLRQIAIGFTSYARDNNGALFVAPHTGNPHNSFWSWGGVTMDYDYSYLGAPWNKDTHPYERGINPYLPAKSRVYICPNDPPGDTKIWSPIPPEDSQAYYSSAGSSYQYNAYLIRSYGYRKLSQIRQASTTILANEWPAYDVPINFYRPAWWTDLPRWSFHDNGGAGTLPQVNDENGNNTVFPDGHVKYVGYWVALWRTDDYDWLDGK